MLSPPCVWKSSWEIYPVTRKCQEYNASNNFIIFNLSFSELCSTSFCCLQTKIIKYAVTPVPSQHPHIRSLHGRMSTERNRKFDQTAVNSRTLAWLSACVWLYRCVHDCTFSPPTMHEARFVNAHSSQIPEVKDFPHSPKSQTKQKKAGWSSYIVQFSKY